MPTPSRPGPRAGDLRRTYGAVRALDWLTFAVAPDSCAARLSGQLFGCVGLNAAGRTTASLHGCGRLPSRAEQVSGALSGPAL
jgi:hypothetical protein